MGKKQIIAELREENQYLVNDNVTTYDAFKKARFELDEANTKVRQITKQRDEYKEIAVNMTTKLVTLNTEKANLEKELQKAESHRDDYKGSLKAIRIALGFNGETYPKQVIGRIEEMKTQIATQKERLHHTNKLNLEYSGKIASLELNAGVGTDYAQVVDTNHKLVAERDSLLSRLSTSSDTVESLSKRLANANLYINQRNQRIDDLIGDSYALEDENAKLKDHIRVLGDKTKSVEVLNLAITNLSEENDRLSSLVDEAEKRLLDLWVHGSITNKWVRDEKNMFPWLKGWVKAFGYEYDHPSDPNYIVKALNRKFGTNATLQSDILGKEAK